MDECITTSFISRVLNGIGWFFIFQRNKLCRLIRWWAKWIYKTSLWLSVAQFLYLDLFARVIYVCTSGAGDVGDPLFINRNGRLTLVRYRSTFTYFHSIISKSWEKFVLFIGHKFNIWSGFIYCPNLFC